MGIIDGIKKMFGKNEVNDNNNNVPLDIDDEGKRLFREDVIAEIFEKLDKRKNERSVLETRWTLNANYLLGSQFCDINLYNGNEIQQIQPVYDWLEREAFNRISPLIETRIANLKRVKHIMTVKPATNELDDYEKAEISTAILRHAQSSSEFESCINTMIAWNELCGNCFWLSWWDKDKGETYAVEKIADGGEFIYHEGDLEHGLITPYEIYPESIFKQGVKSQRSIILEQTKTVDEIYDLYGLKVEGSSIDTFQLTPVAAGSGFGFEGSSLSLGHRSVEGAEKVVTYFESPSKRRPNGRIAIIVGSEHLVYYGDLPYDQIPIVQIVCKETAGQFFGRSVIEELIPLQRAYNGCINRIHEYIKRIAIQSYVAQAGSIEVEEYEEQGVAPGAILVYKSGYQPPVPIPNGTLPRDVMEERYNLVRDMEYTAGVSQMMVVGSLPSGVKSGKAIENLMEIDNTRLSLTADNIRIGVKELAQLWLKIYKQYANSRRAVKAIGMNGISSAITWSGSDITSFDITFDTENELLFSEESQKQRFFEAYNLGLFADASGKIPERVKYKAREYMKTGNYAELMSLDTLQMQAAQRENVFFESGVTPQMSEFDNHEIHIEEHMRYILQMKFQILKMKKPEYAPIIEAHINQHKQVIQASEQGKMMQIQQLQMMQNKK